MPPRISSPLGQPPVQLKKSPLTPTVVICGETARSIEETRSRPLIVPFESNGLSLYNPCGFGAVTTYIAIGPAGVQRRMRWYATPGISRVTAAGAGGASSNTARKAKVTVRRIRPQFTLAQAAAIVSVVVFLLTTGAHAGPAGHTHDRPVPILMYHLIAEAPAGAAFPELFVSPSDFAAQMNWLAAHGDHAVTLPPGFEDWWRGSPRMGTTP